MSREEDQDQWQDDPLVRALRAPGTSDELARASDYLAMYRDNRPGVGTVRRLASRIGFGATATVTTIALTAGVAAAYTRVLPDPVQQIAHSVLGVVGVPAPSIERPQPQTQPRPPSTGHPNPTSSPTATSRPTSTTTMPAVPQVAASPSVPPAPIGTPIGSPGATPTPSVPPVAQQQPRVPAAVTAGASATRVVVGNPVSVTGVVTSADGHLLARRVVRLATRTGHAWSVVASGRTDRSGRITLMTPGLTQTTVLRLGVGKGVHSPVLHVLVQPIISATVSDASRVSTVSVTVVGGQAGDKVTLYGRRAGKTIVLGSAQLNANGTAVIQVPTPKHQIRPVLRVAGTVRHTSAQTKILLGTP